MANVKLFLAALVVFAVFNSALSITLVLNGCDDCYARARLIHGNHYMDGRSFGAYAVSSNGHVLLLRSAGSSLNGYSIGPRPLGVVRGSPILAGFWADADLRCQSNATDNRVLFEETIDIGFRWLMAAVINVRGFFPDSAVAVHYDNVQRFGCPSTAETNTFSIVIVSMQSTRTTYILYIYEDMSWNRGAASTINAVVGFSNGQGQGIQQRLGLNPASVVSNGLLIYRIDPRFRRFEAEVMANKGNVAYEQQKDGGDGENVILQKFEEKEEALKNRMRDFASQETLQDAETAGNADIKVEHFQDRMKN